MTPEQKADAVRLVEDVIDDTSDHNGSQGYEACNCRVTTNRTGTAVVEALVEAGWTPPAQSTAGARVCVDRPSSAEIVQQIRAKHEDEAEPVDLLTALQRSVERARSARTT